MHQVLNFVLRNGYAVLFAMVLAEQLGLPVPALPILLAMGALAGSGQFSLGIALALAVMASLIGDLAWYELGRFGGRPVLNLLCRISLEPDTCVRRTEDLFARNGVRSLLYAKFVPGLSTAAPPLAGLFRVSLWRFLPFDGAGALLWSGVYILVGYSCSSQLERAAEWAARLGGWLAAILVLLLAGYLGWKYAQRRRFLHRLSVARITPEQLLQKIQAGEEVTIIDLRSQMDLEAEEAVLPGALHILPPELEQRHTEIPRDRDVVLYCT